MIFEGQITGGKEIYNFPSQREEVKVYTTSDITIAFWINHAKSYGAEIEVTSPGGFIGVCGSQARVTGTADVVIL